MASTRAPARIHPMDNDEFASDLDRALRRVQSTGDLDDPATRRARRHRSPAHRRSDGQWPVRNGTSPHSRHSSLDAPTVIPFPTIARTNEARVHALHHHPSEDWEINFNFAEELRRLDPPPATTATATAQRPPRPVPPGWKGKLLVFLGKAGPNAKERSKLMSFVWTFGSTFVQFVIIVTFLAISSKHESPTKPGLTEWHACERPLGAWNAVWVVRICLGSLYSYAIWRREVKLNRQYPPESLAEAGTADPNGTTVVGANNSPLTPTSGPPRFPEIQQRERERERERARQQPPYALTRLGHLVDMLSFVWFLTAHILVYTSVKTCRFAAPHLWWLSFGIMCILYFMIVEVFLVGLVVFIFWPAFWIIWNIGLLLTGRHPSQRTRPRHEIGKLSKTAVDQIPLVLYIPPPPEDTKDKDAATPVVSPDTKHSYPPKPKAAPQKRRFAFLRRSRKTKDGAPKKSKDGKDIGEPKTWEDNWVAGEYPFVRLEGNRAACAICLMDFEEPQRREIKGAEVPTSPTTAGDSSVHEVQVDEVTQEDAQRLQLEDAGDGSQPLRLLQCGHVFHKTCIDPWLTDVSGRCPICQRAVEIAEESRNR